MRQLSDCSFSDRSVAAPIVALLFALAVGSQPCTARAQGTAAAAETLFQQGRDEMAKGNYDSACGKLRHELLLSAPGRSETKLTAMLEPGKTTKVEVAPGAGAVAMAAPMTSTPAPATPIAPTAPANTRAAGKGGTLGCVFGGVGVAGLVVGGVAGVLTLNAKQTNNGHCNETARTCDADGRDAASFGRLFGTMTTAGLAVGEGGTISTGGAATGGAGGTGADNCRNASICGRGGSRVCCAISNGTDGFAQTGTGRAAILRAASHASA